MFYFVGDDRKYTNLKMLQKTFEREHLQVFIIKYMGRDLYHMSGVDVLFLMALFLLDCSRYMFLSFVFYKQ